MKRQWEMILVILVLCVILPMIAVRIGSRMIHAKNPEDTLPTTQSTQATTQPPVTTGPPVATLPPATTLPPETTEPQRQPTTIPVVTADGKTVTMELETYIVGVILGEMPAGFEMEALKAQAVAARTYALRCVVYRSKHKGAVCLKSSCCQAYQTEEAYYARGGTAEGLEKIRTAVDQTRDEVLVYEGELIQATYFSCSGGSTEDAADVWGGDVPYLQAVPSPGEENASAYSKTVRYTAREFANKLGRTLSGTPSTWFGAVTYTDGGGVETMVIGGVSYTGTKLRKLLSLNSTKFTVTADASGVTIVSQGFGHRVGMSQYGADAMAVLGSSYEQILAHYFQGTELTKWTS